MSSSLVLLLCARVHTVNSVYLLSKRVSLLCIFLLVCPPAHPGCTPCPLPPSNFFRLFRRTHFNGMFRAVVIIITIVTTVRKTTFSQLTRVRHQIKSVRGRRRKTKRDEDKPSRDGRKEEGRTANYIDRLNQLLSLPLICNAICRLRSRVFTVKCARGHARKGARGVCRSRTRTGRLVTGTR